VAELDKIDRNFREERWEPAELDGGRLAEIVYTIIRGYVDGRLPARASKPKDMVKACLELENLPVADWPRSIRIQIPRLLLGLYEIRNNRNVGHVGGDVDPNHMDASLVLATSKWLVAELIRIFHNVDLATASTFVDALVDRATPAVWNVAGTKRVLNAALSMTDRTLLLLHSTANPVSARDLASWVEHSNPTVYRSNVLARAHVAKLIEWDRRTGLVHISPLGARYVEDRLVQWQT
jgi:hypothetical protein